MPTPRNPRQAPHDPLDHHRVGDIVTGFITHVGPGSLALDVDGGYGFAATSELPLADNEAPANHYATGDQIKVVAGTADHDARWFSLSVHRTPLRRRLRRTPSRRHRH